MVGKKDLPSRLFWAGWLPSLIDNLLGNVADVSYELKYLQHLEHEHSNQLAKGILRGTWSALTASYYSPLLAVSVSFCTIFGFITSCCGEFQNLVGHLVRWVICPVRVKHKREVGYSIKGWLIAWFRRSTVFNHQLSLVSDTWPRGLIFSVTCYIYNLCDLLKQTSFFIYGIQTFIVGSRLVGPEKYVYTCNLRMWPNLG